MAKLTMLKLPKKPKKSASVDTKRNFLKKVEEIKKENKERTRVNSESARLDKVISGVSSQTVRPSGFSVRTIRSPRRKKTTAAAPKRKRKAAVAGPRKKRAAKKAAPRKKASKRR